MKNPSNKKKRVLLTILIAIPLLILAVLATAAGSLLVKYHRISYAPSEIVERTDTYVMPNYPDVIPGSESITDYPDATDIPGETPLAPETTADTTRPASTDSPVTIAPPAETTVSATTPAIPQDTLFPVTYAPPSTQSPTTNSPAASGPSTNSFANSPNAINVYGKQPIYKVTQKDPDVLNILVLGTDSRNVTLDRGRSDTMIVVSYNKKEGTIKMVSLLRDALIPIEGYGWNRINTAYFFGGVGLAVNTVNQLFGLDIQSFVVVDINGAKEFIDYVGGVDVPITEAEAGLYRAYGKKIEAGVVHLNGEDALMHMRNRTSDSDFGRTRRQRDVIEAIFRKILTEKSLTEIYSICEYAMGMVKTNISATTLLSLAASVAVQSANLTIQTQNAPYLDAYQYAWYNGMAILSFDIAQTAARINDFLF